MDNFRLILILALGGVLFMIYSAWVEDYGSPGAGSGAFTEIPRLIDLSESESPILPSDVPVVAPPSVLGVDSTEGVGRSVLPPVLVETDVIRAEISPRGATLENLWLMDYSLTADDPDQSFQLLKALPPNMFIVQSGLLGQPQGQFPTHHEVFEPEGTIHRLAEGENELSVSFRWQGPAGVEVIKTYIFRRGDYLVQVVQNVVNNGNSPIQVHSYQQLQRTELNDPNKSRFVATYTGGAYFDPEAKYRKIDFKEMARRPLDVTLTGGWVAMVQHYFLAAWIPPVLEPQRFFTRVIEYGGLEPRFIIGQESSPKTIMPDGQYEFSNHLFVGPKLADYLAKAAPGLPLTVDYGWLTIIARPIHWLLSTIHRLVGNWGWAIIILTILIKAAFYKLSEASYKSMAHMRKLTPRMKALKDRYGDDKDRLNQAMMELYKKEKINPLGGCLPILIQIPVFIALYWVLLESVELRHAPFVLWLDNLTSPDPYYVLPLIMGVSMFAQQKLNPPPPDPMQEKIMLALPVVFTVFFAFFPSGLVLYWTVNNLLSIAQQWVITRKIERAERGKAG